MATINTAEKIETVVMSFLHRRTTSGAFGSLRQEEDGSYLVEADGRSFPVRCGAHGWEVTCGAFTGVARDLYEAAADAIAAQKEG